jgi:hypothetical protein
VENRVCLSRGVHVECVVWWAGMMIVAGVGDLMQRTENCHTGRILGGQTIERSGDIVYGLHHAHEDEERGFLGLTSKPRSMFYQWFGLKITGMVSSGLASKSVATISFGLTSKSVVEGFSVWASKPAATV